MRVPSESIADAARGRVEAAGAARSLAATSVRRLGRFVDFTGDRAAPGRRLAFFFAFAFARPLGAAGTFLDTVALVLRGLACWARDADFAGRFFSSFGDGALAARLPFAGRLPCLPRDVAFAGRFAPVLPSGVVLRFFPNLNAPDILQAVLLKDGSNIRLGYVISERAVPKYNGRFPRWC